MLLTLLGDLRGLAASANFGWLDFGPCPVPWARAYLGFFGSLLVLYAVFPSMPTLIRALAVLCVFAGLGMAGWNAFRYYEQLRSGFIHSKLPIALSLHIGALLIVVLAGLFAGRRKSVRPGRDLFFALVTFAICVVGFPVAQIFCNGQTDERRAADAAVVFACDLPRGEDADKALEARVKTACDLYNDKQVRMLILAGGPGADGVHQSEEMRRIAVGLGVAETDILPETTGTDTRSAVTGSLDHLKEHELYNVLVVNDFHLLPRIKLSYRRAGVAVDTVPVESSMDPARWKKEPNEIAKEATALWLFYVEPLML